MNAPPTPLRTNRDLYLHVAELAASPAAGSRDLEQYLAALWRLGAGLPRSAPLALGRFAQLLEEAFSAPVPAARPERRERAAALASFERWERVIAAQLADLRELRAAGAFQDELRYFGLDAPSGARWYNFDPGAFLECGAQGAFGGWQEGDGTGRGLVPGKVAVVGADGEITSADPEDIEEPIVEIPEVSWDRFAEFLWAGQCYE